MKKNIHFHVLANPAYKCKNPYCQLLYTNLIELGLNVKEFSERKLFWESYDIYHIHWPEYAVNKPNILIALISMCKFLLFVLFLKLVGTKIIWTAHNLKSHEQKYPQLEKLFWRCFIPLVDGVICLSNFTQTALLEKFEILQHKLSIVIPHGHYCSVYPNTISKDEARNILKLPQEDFVISFIGQIRAYKNVPNLIKIFCTLSNNKQLRLIVAGKVRTPKLMEEIKAAAEEDERVSLYLDFVPDNDLQIYLNATDLVVLPANDIFNSGSALLALSFYRPILVPENGSMINLKEHFGSNWINTYQGHLTNNHLRNAIHWVLEEPRSKPEALNYLEWHDIAKKTADFYEFIINLEQLHNIENAKKNT
jgi:glycosyltransferase involved in cell wall biosynthesis